VTLGADGTCETNTASERAAQSARKNHLGPLIPAARARFGLRWQPDGRWYQHSHNLFGYPEAGKKAIEWPLDLDAIDFT